MKTASRPQLRRLLVLDRMIRDRGFPNTRTVADELEVSRRTVLRDVEFRSRSRAHIAAQLREL
jgi:predicted DNA-binding transcriptional regulator YafY